MSTRYPTTVNDLLAEDLRLASALGAWRAVIGLFRGMPVGEYILLQEDHGKVRAQWFADAVAALEVVS